MDGNVPGRCGCRALIVFSALHLLLPLAPGSAEREGAPAPAAWPPELAPAAALFEAQDYRRARRKCHRLIFALAQGNGVAQAEAELAARLARVNLLDALAATALGLGEDAVWRWHLARVLDPAIELEDLSPHGEAGRSLMAQVERERELVHEGSRVETAGRPFAPPAVARRQRVLTPAWVAGDQASRVMVRVLVDVDGRPRAPVVLFSSGGPAILQAALESLSAWRFLPARLDDRPVAFVSLVTIELAPGGTSRLRP